MFIASRIKIVTLFRWDYVSAYSDELNKSRRSWITASEGQT